ncbi:MAG: hypothetical protein N2257_05610 [Thermodesulfovibrionales bacterium]|nr:hypothetical protein [Thermodesulfovibrionales bacterium]
MDPFVKNFIGASIVYLFLSTVFGILMLYNPAFLKLKFVHSHLNMLGWVSMMIYGVGYHILPRFAGRRLKSPALAEIQFYIANIGLIGMLLFYTLETYEPGNSLFRGLTVASGILEAFSIIIFVYNMIATLYTKEKTQ